MRQQVRQIEELRHSLRRLPGTLAASFKASEGYGGLYEQLKTIATRVVVAHPGALQIIYCCQRKNDRPDAKKLAKLSLLDLVPSVHLLSEEMRAWGELITFQRELIQARTRAKNDVRAFRIAMPCAGRAPGELDARSRPHSSPEAPRRAARTCRARTSSAAEPNFHIGHRRSDSIR